MHISSLKIVKSFINIDYILNCGYCQVLQKYALNLSIRDRLDHGCSFLSGGDSIGTTKLREHRYTQTLFWHSLDWVTPIWENVNS